MLVTTRCTGNLTQVLGEQLTHIIKFLVFILLTFLKIPGQTDSKYLQSVFLHGSTFNKTFSKREDFQLLFGVFRLTISVPFAVVVLANKMKVTVEHMHGDLNTAWK